LCRQRCQLALKLGLLLRVINWGVALLQTSKTMSLRGGLPPPKQSNSPELEIVSPRQAARNDIIATEHGGVNIGPQSLGCA
jgi:hypothetical protein